MSEPVTYPLFSIVTVVFNNVREIEKTIASCLGQDFSDKEYILIDGGSKDGTMDIVNRYADKITTLISEADRGLYDGMNKAIGVAKGDWILFMNSGDTFCGSGVLSKVAKAIHEMNATPDVIYGDAIFAYAGINLIKKPLPLHQMEREMVLCHQSTFVRTCLMKETLFDLKYKLAADYDVMLKFYHQHRHFVYLSICVSVCNQMDGKTQRNFKRSTRERYSIQKDSGSCINRFLYFKTILRMQVVFWVKKLIPAWLTLFVFKNKYRDRRCQ